MSKKNILFISDDFSGGHIPMTVIIKRLIERRTNKFKLFFSESFVNFPEINFDAVFVDFGFIDNCYHSLEESLNTLDKFNENNIKLVWCGGLGGRIEDFYNIDAKRLFPTKRYLHNLPSCSTSSSEILDMLNYLFKNNEMS